MCNIHAYSCWWICVRHPKYSRYPMAAMSSYCPATWQRGIHCPSQFSGTIWCTSACRRARTSRNVWLKRSGCLSNSSCPSSQMFNISWMLGRGMFFLSCGHLQGLIMSTPKNPKDRMISVATSKRSQETHLSFELLYELEPKYPSRVEISRYHLCQDVQTFSLGGVTQLQQFRFRSLCCAGWNMWRRTRKAQSILTGFGRWRNSTRHIWRWVPWRFAGWASGSW